jgi:hypothetical protein
MKPEVRYINAYVSGTAVPQPEEAPQKRPSAKLPPIKKTQQQKCIQVDVMAVAGILTALAMCVMLVSGLVQMNQAQKEATMFREYVAALQSENTQLMNTYTSGYDLEEVQSIAQTMGMVPVNQVPHIPVQVNVPEIPQEPSAWENFWAFLTGMFA